ncbi:proton-coupled amino acid transporter 1-like [Phlebotomus argentipes]|uniref:proton-coupled amino acid transporter 1-like n=1 Tax=Phlebotomus argentipes TaxID=94469 RepID=UPI0028929FF1|nr:proton-coupled amino acid transporter 1-like [Phlebotomus argentipes]
MKKLVIVFKLLKPIVAEQKEHGSNLLYHETLVHLFKSNIGSGLYAMGDAMKNGGIILGPCLTLIIATVCVHCQHILLRCSRKVRNQSGLDSTPDYAKTVELCFANGPESLRFWSKGMGITVNIFICVSQLSFCCVIIVFITTNLQQIWNQYNIPINEYWNLIICCTPILLINLITNLRVLVPFSLLGSICIMLCTCITLFFLLDDLPNPSERNFVGSWKTLPLFFGTNLYAFEGIALVLPLQNSMKVPRDFYRPAGVLNIGMILVTSLLGGMGVLGYLKYGEAVEGSLSLNLPLNDPLAQAAKALICLGILFGYHLMFFVAVEIMWPIVKDKLRVSSLLLGERIFRVALIIITMLIAKFVPKLSLFISLIGAVLSTALALIFPPLIDLLCKWETNKGLRAGVLMKNILIVLIALLGFITCGYESLVQLIREFSV